MSYTPDRWTDKELEALEKRIAKVYKEAEQDLTKEVNEYFAKFKIRDKEMKDLVDAGEMTNADYMKWRSTQMGRGQRFEALRDKVAERYTKANEVANAYVNDATPSIYSLNRNYEAYTIEKTVGSCDFTLWDESTVRRLLAEEPDLMPYYPPERALQRGIDLAYGKDQITKRVTSGIIRGLSPGKIANELMAGITTMNRESAVRAARTGITAAENAGRLDSWRAAENMGITIRRRWVCTKDARTRTTHGQADGQIVEGTKTPFIVGGYKMMFPGDKSMGAPGHEIYNCRCTTRTVEKDGIEAEPRQMRVRDADGNWQVVNEMSYKEWENWKKGIENSGNSGIIEAAKFTQFDDGNKANDFFYYDDEKRGLMAKKNSEYGKWKAGLSGDSKDALYSYTADGYGDVNDYLRKVNGWDSIDAARVEEQVKQIDSAISSFKLKDNIVVQRGAGEASLDCLFENGGINELTELIGHKYHDDGFMSSTVLMGNPVATTKPVVFDISIPAGQGRGAYINEFGSQFQDAEYEFLIKRGASFTITDISEDADLGKIYVKMVMDVE